MEFLDKVQEDSSYSYVSGNVFLYVVLQVTLIEKFLEQVRKFD